jgi:hypothetical protein
MTLAENETCWGCVHFFGESQLKKFATVSLVDVAVFSADVSTIRDDKMVLRLLASVLNFPEYFGVNWDALDECLSDMEWAPARGYRLILSGSEEFWTSRPTTAGRLVSAWLIAAERWAKINVPFDLIFLR